MAKTYSKSVMVNFLSTRAMVFMPKKVRDSVLVTKAKQTNNLKEVTPGVVQHEWG